MAHCYRYDGLTPCHRTLGTAQSTHPMCNRPFRVARYGRFDRHWSQVAVEESPDFEAAGHIRSRADQSRSAASQQTRWLSLRAKGDDVIETLTRLAVRTHAPAQFRRL